MKQPVLTSFIALGLAAAGASLLAPACALRLSKDQGDVGLEGEPCTDSEQCPNPTDPCLLAYCMERRCVHVPSPEGMLPEEAQQAGDCQQLYCDGQGRQVGYEAHYDLPPDDKNPCTEAVCNQSKPEYRSLEAGARCGKDGVCNGAGRCGVCLPAAKRCEANGVIECGTDGQWAKAQPCPSATPVCNAAQCVGVVEFALGAQHGCARLDDSTVRCWGRADGGRLGNGGLGVAQAPPWAIGFRSVAVGSRHGCGVDSSNSLWCWGANDYGQLGDGSYASTNTPRLVTIATPDQVVVGVDHSCALSTDGSVSCWGSNARGQLGKQAPATAAAARNTPPSSAGAIAKPTPIAGLSAATGLQLAADHTCVTVSGNSSPKCWGLTPYSLPPNIDDPEQVKKLKTNSANTAQPVAGLPPAASIAAGADFTCALARDGTVWCWGENQNGQLGAGSGNYRHTAKAIKGLTGVRQLAVGASFGCALLKTGNVHCWGRNDRGQAGNGGKTAVAKPQAIAGLAPVVALATGRQFVCALRADRRLVCWGAASAGQLGRGRGSDQPRPTPIW